MYANKVIVIFLFKKKLRELPTKSLSRGQGDREGCVASILQVSSQNFKGPLDPPIDIVKRSKLFG